MAFSCQLLWVASTALFCIPIWIQVYACSVGGKITSAGRLQSGADLPHESKGQLVDSMCSSWRRGSYTCFWFWFRVPARPWLYIIPALRLFAFHQTLPTSIPALPSTSFCLSTGQLLHPQVDGTVSPLGTNECRPTSVHFAPTNGHHEQHWQEHPPQSQQAQARDDALVQVGTQLGVVHLQLLHLAGRHRVRVDFGLTGDGVCDDYQNDPTHQEHQGEDEAVVGRVVIAGIKFGEVLAFLLPSTSFFLIIRPWRELLLLVPLVEKKERKKNKQKKERVWTCSRRSSILRQRTVTEERQIIQRGRQRETNEERRSRGSTRLKMERRKAVWRGK